MHMQAGFHIFQSDSDFQENFYEWPPQKLGPQGISLWSNW